MTTARFAAGDVIEVIDARERQRHVALSLHRGQVALRPFDPRQLEHLAVGERSADHRDLWSATKASWSRM